MTLNRRQFTQAAAALAASGATPLVFAADTLKIGYVSPQTGPLAPFGEADKWVIDQMKTAFKDGISVGGRKYDVQIVLKDSQSNPNRAGEVANDLILKDKVALVLTAGTPETANPVSDACELNEVPCISSVVPWQPWFFGRKGDPAKGFNWTYHLFWGLEDVIANFTNGWKTVPTNKKVGGLFPNDGDGNAWGDKELGFPKPLSQMGFTLDRPGPLPERHAGLQRADRGVQEGRRGDRHRRGDPARCQDLPHAGAAAGLQAEDHHAGQGAAVPGRDRGAGRTGRRPVDRGVVEPVASLHVEPDEAERQGAGRGLRGGHEEAVDAADRLCACAVRGGGRCAVACQVA